MSVIEFTARVFREQKLRLTMAIVASVVASFFESFGIALLLPLLQMIMSPNGSGGRVGEIIARLLGLFGVSMNIRSVLVFIVLLVGVQQVVMLAQQKLIYGSQHRLEAGLRERLYRHIFRARWEFFVKTRTGDIVSALVQEVNRCGQAFQALSMMISNIIVSIAYLGLAILLSWQATVVIGIGSLLIMLIFKSETSRGKTLGTAITKANQEFSQEVLEQISAAKLIKGYGNQAAVILRLRRYYDALAHAMFRGNFHNARLKAFLDAGMGAMLALTIYVAVALMNMSFARLVVFLFVFYRLSPRLSNIQTTLHRINILIPALHRIDLLENAAVSIMEENGTRRLDDFTRSLNLRNVSFSYNRGNLVLNEVDIDIPKGKTVAIVGSSGAGKSTVIDLIIGLMDPNKGQVLLDGVSLPEYDMAGWKSKLGYVAQDTVLFNDSVKANISWPASKVDMDRVIEAAKLAYAHEFIEVMPDGYDTIIGTRGVKLSGGQRQRLALARAIIRQPELLILDEATSALDAESERKIQEAVEALAGEMTIVIVTHRLATVRNADLIYVLEKGSVIERGTWEELAGAKGRFGELKSLQALD